MDNKRILPFIVLGVIALFVLAGISSSLFYTIEAGQRAVIFEKFGEGLDKENIIDQGFHTKAPWNEVYVYDVQENTIDENMDNILDKNGLPMHVEISVRYKLIEEKIGYIHEIFGPTYVTKLIIPEMRSAIRQVMGRFTAEEIYSTKRAEVEATIKTESEKILNANNVTMVALLIKAIVLPEQIRIAIESKLQQEQEALAYRFRLEKEKSEAERKRIAAEGESRANNIINNSLTDKLLKMRGIEATLELAKSPNSKVVIVGSSKDGLPMILGGN